MLQDAIFSNVIKNKFIISQYTLSFKSISFSALFEAALDRKRVQKS